MQLEKIFSIKNSKDMKHKIITILGIKIKIHKQCNFPLFSKNVRKIYTQIENLSITNSRAAIFVGFDSNASIAENTLSYLKEIRRHVDYLVLVYDNPITVLELRKIKKIADAVIFERHQEYDFGSYKRGYLLLKEQGILDKVQNIFFINDSVFYIGHKFDDVFNKNESKDFYGLTIHDWGYDRNIQQEGSYNWVYAPHIQSYFFSLSSSIFKSGWFEEFICSVKQLKHKKDIIIDYEMGLSKLIKSKGYELFSYYKEIHEDIEPIMYYLNDNSNYDYNVLLVKKYLMKKENKNGKYSSVFFEYLQQD